MTYTMTGNNTDDMKARAQSVADSNGEDNKLNKLMVMFKEEFVNNMNEDIYSAFKDFVGEQGMSAEQSAYVRDYFCEYLTGYIVWKEEDGSLTEPTETD